MNVDIFITIRYDLDPEAAEDNALPFAQQRRDLYERRNDYMYVFYAYL